MTLTPSALQSQHDALMREWRSRHEREGKQRFVKDGVLCAAKYLSSTPKICFLLKEAHFARTGSLVKWLNKGGMTPMWATVAEWASGLQRTTAAGPLPKKPALTDNAKTELLRSVAIVNVKKSEGVESSDYSDLLDYVEADQDLLRRQIELLDPDVIVCGNNSSFLRVLYDAGITPKRKVDDAGEIDHKKMLANGYIVFNGRIILDYYHPANQFPSKLNYYTICALYQQALEEKG